MLKTGISLIRFGHLKTTLHGEPLKHDKADFFIERGVAAIETASSDAERYQIPLDPKLRQLALNLYGMHLRVARLYRQQQNGHLTFSHKQALPAQVPSEDVPLE